MNNEHDKQVYDLQMERMRIAAEDGPLSDQQRERLARINSDLKVDTIDLTECDSTTLDSNVLRTALRQLVNHHMCLYLESKEKGEGYPIDHLVSLLFASHNFSVSVTTMVAGQGCDSFTNFASNVATDVFMFVMDELDYNMPKEIYENIHFKWIYDRK